MEKTSIAQGKVGSDPYYAITQLYIWGGRLDAGVNHQKENPRVVTLDLPTEGNAGISLYLPEDLGNPARYEAWIGDDGNTGRAEQDLGRLIRYGLDSEPDWQSPLEPGEDSYPDVWDEILEIRKRYEGTGVDPVNWADRHGPI